MERLRFRCPNTGREVDAGVETDLNTLLRIKNKPVRVLCPACGGEHEWRVSEAQLAKAD